MGTEEVVERLAEDFYGKHAAYLYSEKMNLTKKEIATPQERKEYLERMQNLFRKEMEYRSLLGVFYQTTPGRELAGKITRENFPNIEREINGGKKHGGPGEDHAGRKAAHQGLLPRM